MLQDYYKPKDSFTVIMNVTQTIVIAAIVIV